MRVLPVALAAAMALPLAAAPAGAATWSGAKLLPETAVFDFSTRERSSVVADPLGRVHVITGSSTGTLWRTVNTDGTLGDAQPFPVITTQTGSQAGRPWHVAFQADGSAIVGWLLKNGTGWFTWRSPTGTWGPNILTAPAPIQSVAVRPGEALLGSAPQARVYSVSIGADGALAFGPVAHLEGQSADAYSVATMVVAVDPSGTAGAVYGRPTLIRKASRDANGTWTPETVDTFTGAGQVGNVRGGSFGGRMVAAYYRRDGASESPSHVDHVKALYREPGGAIGAPVPIATQSTQTGSRLSTAFGAAAGPDGTLGVVHATYQCANTTLRGGTGGVRIVPPGQPLSNAVTEGVSALTTSGDSAVITGNGFTISEFQPPAAGDGRMAFSVNRVTSPGINGTDPGRACGGSGQPSQPTTVDSVAVLTGANGATATVESGSSPTGNNVSGQIRSWYGAAVTDDGVGAVVGTKDEGQAHRLYLAGTPRADGRTPPDDGGKDDDDGGGGPAPGGGDQPGQQQQQPAVPPPPPPAAPPAVVPVPQVLRSAPVRLTSARSTRDGVDVTVRIPTARGLTTTIDIVVQFQNLPRGRAAAAQARRAVTLARTRRVVRRGGRLTLRLKYTKAGRALIRRRKRVRATIRLVTTVQGRAPVTSSQTVTLRARR